MVVNKSFLTLVFYVFLSVYLLVFITACRKPPSSEAAVSKLSFTYQGVQYVLPRINGTSEWGIDESGSGIYINRPDIFNGTIRFPYPNCAYLEPNFYSLERYANCQLSSSGLPIDSIAVYLFQSGFVHIFYKNCYEKSGYDPFTRQTYTYSVCDANVTFNLTLINKENKTISITDGKLELYRLRR